MSTDHEQLAKDQIATWIRERNPDMNGDELDNQTPLIEKRLLTSIKVTQLLMFLEEMRGHPVDPELLKPGAFQDIDTIYRHFLTEDQVTTRHDRGAEPRVSFEIPGLLWKDNGQSVLSGDLLLLADRLDRKFLTLAADWNADEYRFPTFISAAQLDHMCYFWWFPQLVTFPVTLDIEEANLQAFRDTVKEGGHALQPDGSIELTRTAPIRDAMTPAACYHFYINLQGRTFDKPQYYTTKATCFRREKYYFPLERQWSFSMREIVCIGTAEEVRAFLDKAVESLDSLVKRLGMSLTWEQATDPFFQPILAPGYIMQKVDPVKHELLFDGRLAISSANYHYDNFGEVFEITTQRDGETKNAYSACLAFGVERWLAAITQTFGPDAKGWPDIESA